MKALYFLTVFSLVFWMACAEKRAKKYETLLSPLIGKSRKPELNKQLGEPTFCKLEGEIEVCEYRTTKSHNENIPAVLQKAEGFPDLSPYDYFDVLHLTFDASGNFKSWEPVVLPP